MDNFDKLFASRTEVDTDTDVDDDIEVMIPSLCENCDNFPICNIVDKIVELTTFGIVADIITCKYEK